MDLIQRIDQPEIMDTAVLPVAVMKETLRFLEITNRYFGGAQVILKHFEKWSKNWPEGKEVRILDVGSGGGEIPIAIVKWAKSKGLNVRVHAIDLVVEVVSVALEKTKEFSEISIECQDVFGMSQGKPSFDYVIASLLLHHIPPADSVRLLRTFDALSTRGIIISDLLRSQASYWAVKSLSWLIGNEIVRHDGPLSVRRSFRADELTLLAKEAGLPYLSAKDEPWFRLSLAGEKE